jgi:RNA polymerase sigma-70 factor (ECF subfamily)
VQRALVERAMDGDADAFDALARTAGDRLMGIAYRILRERAAAQDAVQAALISAWRQVPSLRDPDRFDAWLHRLLVNACYAELGRVRRARTDVQLIPVHDTAGSDELVGVADRDQLERAFRRLPPDQRAVFVFHHHVGLSLSEIADELGIPLGTVKSRLHYAASSLRAAVAADARTPSPRERTA